MSRVKTVVAGRRRRRKVLTAAKGYWGGKHRLYQSAKEALMKAGQYAYRDRRNRRRDFRRLWIIRVNAAAKAYGLSYHAFMAGIKKAGVALDRRMMADLAVTDPEGFAKLAEVAKGV
jgi:large subunit ribosomal protein L20